MFFLFLIILFNCYTFCLSVGMGARLIVPIWLQRYKEYLKLATQWCKISLTEKILLIASKEKY